MHIIKIKHTTAINTVKIATQTPGGSTVGVIAVSAPDPGKTASGLNSLPGVDAIKATKHG
jgi:hypothetical protein